MEPRIPEEPGSPSLLRPRTVGEILADAFHLYARHWQNLIGDLLIGEGFSQEELRGGVEVSTGTAVGGVLAAIVLAFVSILMWTILTGAITRAAAGTFLRRDLEIGDSYRY